jgi:hypothetical protein
VCKWLTKEEEKGDDVPSLILKDLRKACCPSTGNENPE